MPIRRSSWLLAAFLALPAPGVAGEGAESTSGQVRLGPGLTVAYDYHFDHNAFADSVDLPGGLVALTRSGNLLRFDPATLKRDREWFGPSPATCIGPGRGGSALVGFEDGRVARLDPANLALATVATLPGKPYWVGSRGGDVVAVAERWKWARESIIWEQQHGFPRPADRPFPALKKDYREVFVRYSEVHDLGTGRVIPFKGRAATTLLDRNHRLWLGYNLGEFGGWCRSVDLAAGRARVVRAPIDPADGREGYWDCVLGFAELRDGQVWAHGGVMHGLGTILIRRVDGEKVEELAKFEGEPDKGFGPGKPAGPIDRIIEEPKPGSLLAFCEGTVYRTDATLKTWEKVHDLNLRYPNWRPDAGDDYPIIRAVHRRGEGLVVATARDGYVLLGLGGDRRDVLPGQLEADRIADIRVTEEGTFFLDWPGETTAWRLRDRLWTHGPILPTGEQESNRDRVFFGPTGAIYGVGDRGTARWRGGKAEALGGPAPAGWITPFALPDGTLWGVAGDDGDLPGGRLVRLLSRWAKVADLPDLAEWTGQRIEYLGVDEVTIRSEGEETRLRRVGDAWLAKPAGRGFTVGRELRVVNEAGPPWVLFDPEQEQLLALTYGPGSRDPRLVPLRFDDGPLRLKVYDAIPWGRSDVLIATRKGLKLCEVAAGVHRPAPLPSPDRAVRRIAVDGLGRTWMAGEGLWMVEPDGRTLRDLAPLPMIGRSGVEALAADPAHRGGVIVSLGARGVAFVRLEAGP